MFSIEKGVALLTPTVFAPLAALLTKLITVNVPGSHVTSGQLTALEITAFTGAVAMGAHWLQGQKQWRLLSLQAQKAANTIPAVDRTAIEAEIAAVVGALTKVQAQPGTPADQIVHGLAPDPAPAPAPVAPAPPEPVVLP